MGEVVGWTLILAGVLLTILAGIGLLRFPDVFARMHAATKPAILGLVLVLGGTAMLVDQPGDRVKLLLVAAFQLVTAPVAAHMVGRAAHRAGTHMSPLTSIDELADAREAEELRRRGDDRSGGGGIPGGDVG